VSLPRPHCCLRTCLWHRLRSIPTLHTPPLTPRPRHPTHTQVPLVTMVGASNELPESEELDALYDRFLIRKEVKQVTASGLGSMLDYYAGGWGGRGEDYNRRWGVVWGQGTWGRLGQKPAFQTDWTLQPPGVILMCWGQPHGKGAAAPLQLPQPLLRLYTIHTPLLSTTTSHARR
jgi:hypothetical protein